MQLQAVNTTSYKFKAGGEEILPNSSRFIRSSLITDEEKKAIQDAGYIIRFTHIFVIEEKSEEVEEIAEVTEVDTEDDEQSLTDSATDTTEEAEEIADNAYPSEVIKADGSVSKAPVAKAKLAEVEALGLPMLDDNEFKAKYPNVDIEKHRVEV